MKRKSRKTLIQPVEEDQENTIAEENNAILKTDEDQTTPEIPENIAGFSTLNNGLKKTRDSITRRIDESFSWQVEELEELEEILITSDMG